MLITISSTCQGPDIINTLPVWWPLQIKIGGAIIGHIISESVFNYRDSPGLKNIM